MFLNYLDILEIRNRTLYTDTLYPMTIKFIEYNYNISMLFFAQNHRITSTECKYHKCA